MHRGRLEWLYVRTKFHENIPSSLEAISGDTQTDR
jgi:hypothetical protein